ncbi:MAG: hypothetical protein LBE36_02835 [Flavobacteriaceae bacterium]|jgi:hypothetical protein|nr:hypothetical protein [Flavobacteriaceae bacterium]
MKSTSETGHLKNIANFQDLTHFARRLSVENGIPCLTSMDTVEAILKVIESVTFKPEAM